MDMFKAGLCVVLSLTFHFALAQDFEKKADECFNEGNYGLAVKYYGQVKKPKNADAFEYKENKAKEYRMYMMKGDDYYREGDYEDAIDVFTRLFELHPTNVCRHKIDSCNIKIDAIKQERTDYERLYYAEGTDFVELAIEYLKKYPNGKNYSEVKDALENIEERIWREALSTSNINGYYYYVKAFPNGSHVEEARAQIREMDDEAWNNAKHINTIESYQTYINSDYDGHAVEAQNRIDGIRQEEKDYKKCISSDSENEIRAFLDKYPNSKYADEIRKRLAFVIDENDWRKAVQTNTIESYEQYISSSTGSKKHLSEARRNRHKLIDYQLWIEADSINTIMGYEQYISTCNLCENKNIAISRKQIIKLQEELITSALSYLQDKKYEDAYNMTIQAERKGHLPKYLRVTALTCKEPYEYKQAIKSKDKVVIEKYLKTYSEVAVQKHIDKAKKKISK